MSEKQIELPPLRPIRVQGKAYYVALRAILKEIGDDLYADAVAAKHAHTMTPRMLCQLALTYRLNLKATTEYLEDRKVIRCGTYDRVFRESANLRPIASLKETWAEMQGEVSR